MNVLNLQEGRYYIEPKTKTFFKLWRGELLASRDAVNWKASHEVVKFDVLKTLEFREVSLSVTYNILPTEEEVKAAEAKAALDAKSQEVQKALPEITQEEADKVAKALTAGSTPEVPSELSSPAT